MIRKIPFTGLILLFFTIPQINSQDNVFMSDVSGFTLTPLLTTAIEPNELLFYFDLQYERGLYNNKSLFFTIEYGKNGVSETLRNNNPVSKIVTKSLSLTFEYRDYYSKKKDSPFGFYSGIFYKHSFLRDKYYDYVNNNYQYIETDKGNMFSVGGRLGYKFGNKIVIDPSVFLSLAYTSGIDRNGEVESSTDLFRRFTIPAGIKVSIGYAF